MQVHAAETLTDKEAEQAVLGAMMTEKMVIPRVIALLGHTPEAFFTTDHQLIYTAILDVYDRFSKVDAILVADELNKTEKLNRVGGAGYLYELQAPIVETDSTEFYAQIIYEKSTRRRLIQAGAQIREFALDEQKELEDVLNDSQESIFQLSQHQLERGFTSARPLLKESIEMIEKLWRERDQEKKQFLGGTYRFHRF